MRVIHNCYVSRGDGIEGCEMKNKLLYTDLKVVCFADHTDTNSNIKPWNRPQYSSVLFTQIDGGLVLDDYPRFCFVHPRSKTEELAPDGDVDSIVIIILSSGDAFSLIFGCQFLCCWVKITRLDWKWLVQFVHFLPSLWWSSRLPADVDDLYFTIGYTTLYTKGILE